MSDTGDGTARSGTGTVAPIVGQIAAADRRRRLLFRLAFVFTWVIILGGFVLWLVSGDRFDIDFITKHAPFIIGAAPLTIFIAFSSIILAIGFAFLGALGRISTFAPTYAIATLYVSVVRGTPLIVQILFVFIALPQIVPAAARIPIVGIGIFALAFNYGAYMTEIFRAGIVAVPSGQREAAAALGMSERRIMLRVVMPQAIRIVTPAIGNEFIAMIKDSALVSIIGIQELLWRARTIGSANFRSFETLILAATVFWILTIIFSFFQERLEQRMARGDR